jgi:hypothetical protein
MMEDAETYRRYARECERLATLMSEEHRNSLREIAEAWLTLARQAEAVGHSSEQV